MILPIKNEGIFIVTLVFFEHLYGDFYAGLKDEWQFSVCVYNDPVERFEHERIAELVDFSNLVNQKAHLFRTALDEDVLGIIDRWLQRCLIAELLCYDEIFHARQNAFCGRSIEMRTSVQSIGLSFLTVGSYISKIRLITAVSCVFTWLSSSSKINGSRMKWILISPDSLWLLPTG